MENNIYFISGLGADKRVFTRIEKEYPGHKHIEWERPYKNETLSEYSQRLISQIDKKENIVLIGVSLGGIIAQEIAKLIPVKKLIIISSIKNENEMDWKLQWISTLGLYRLFPASVLKFFNLLTADYYFGITSKEESRLLHQIIKDTDPVFMVWAIDRLMKWQNKELQPLLHIHGTKDRIFPPKNIANSLPVAGGGHFMIQNRSEELIFLINQYLNL